MSKPILRYTIDYIDCWFHAVSTSWATESIEARISKLQRKLYFMTFHKFLKINLILCTEGCFFVFQEAFDSNERKLESVD